MDRFAFPGVVAYEMVSQHFVANFFQQMHDFARSIDTRPVARHSESKMDSHARTRLYRQLRDFSTYFCELVIERKL
jgi:hypothetical protein